ncbi:hypothetical protein LYSHEL_21580 [Lysobacter helvus]|uniref:HEAT repeat domain-containing protein n=2 Tax=Lysobacteraceae TaxID=32033 RepID=A0ABN6FVZ0_9GAMM|nr:MULTISPECIES: hypothetical protein [Lysobacter]BCT93135.1 hypothetical protein LYSCAS_21590 [Lysobacter caseinilyticus]BCT96287.1 hypothetical protein LYSHEL_21580 [Lysobacter helvus]
MSRDRDIERAIQDGERNQHAKRLIHNWCRHARVEKFGGTGMIEMQTGLPIGHHAMACDFASASGMATWMLEESAVRFHDANCVGCPHRVPVALPNLSMLVAQRDADRQDAETRAEDAQRVKETALQARAAARAELRATLPVLAKAFMDDLDRLDAERNEQAATRLIESARLAPEILVPALTEYLFSVLEGDDHWLEAAALTVLADTADQRRLVRCAMKCLRQGYALELAAATVTQRLDLVDAADVPEAVMGLAYVASPPRSEFGRLHYDDCDPNPLMQVADRFPEAVERGLLALLTRRDRLRVGVTSRAMGMLIARNTRWIRPFLRPLAAHLSRLDVLVEFERESELRQIVHDLQVALAYAFLAGPDFADDELMRQFESASDDGEGRVAGVYEHVLRHADRDRDAKSVIDPAHTQAFVVAIRRLAALSVTSDNNEVSQHVLGAFRRQSGAFAPAAKVAMDALLGTAAVLDSKLQAPEQEPSVLTPPDPLAEMVKASRRTRLWHLRAALLEVAIHGALTDADGLARFEAFLSQRGLLGDTFEAAVVRELAPLLATSTGLNTMLPHLYSTMVGASVAGRAAAADALKDIGSQRFSDLPDLVADSLVLMLFDPYVIVHKAAVQALGRLRLPAHFNPLIAAALDNLIVAYRGGNDPEFLLECIEAKVTTYRGEGPLPKAQGQVLVALVSELETSVLLRSGHRYFLTQFQHLDGWAALVLGWIGHCRQDYELEHALELVADLPLGACAPHVPAILEAVATDPSNPQLCSTFVELLTRDRAWRGATQVAALHVAAFPDTVRERARRLQAQQLERRVSFEHLISEGKLDEALALGQAWMQVNEELAQLFKNDEKFPFF